MGNGDRDDFGVGGDVLLYFGVRAASGEGAGKLTIRSTSGVAVMVDRAVFEAASRRLPEGVAPTFTRIVLARLAENAPNEQAFVSALNQVAQEKVGVFRVENESGQPWRPGVSPTDAATAGSVADDVADYFFRNPTTNPTAVPSTQRAAVAEARLLEADVMNFFTPSEARL